MKKIIMIAVILLSCVVGKGFYEKCKIQDSYEHALDLMEEGEYQEAREELQILADELLQKPFYLDKLYTKQELYYDTYYLDRLCKAHMCYEGQDYEGAQWYLDGLKFKYLTLKQEEELQIEEFQKEVNDAYDVWKKEEYEEEERKKREMEMEADRILKDLNIQEEDTNTDRSCGSSYRRNTYQPAYTYDDLYDVYDYDDPEDFYYDNEDDFDGYEDAEDYWEDAWNE